MEHERHVRMSEHDYDKLLNRVALKVRIIEDCLTRALDALEDRPAEWMSGDYLNGQVDRGHDAAIDAASALMANGYPKFPC